MSPNAEKHSPAPILAMLVAAVALSLAPSTLAETPVEPALRVAQAQPSTPTGGDGRQATLGDIRWQDERNDKRWNDMNAERRSDMNEIRAEIRALNGRIDNLFVLLLGGMGALVLGVLWFHVTRRREDSEARSRGRAPLPPEPKPGHEPAH